MPINFDHHKVELNWGGQPLDARDRQDRPPGGRRRARHARRDRGPRHRRFGQEAEAGPGLLPADRELLEEKYFAAGKIPGGYFKREGRPTENETLVSRLIDRPIRPLFPEGYKNETQVVITVLQHDMENNPDVLAMVAASPRR